MVSVQIELAALSGGDGVDDEFVRHVSVQIELAALSGENQGGQTRPEGIVSVQIELAALSGRCC